jgi:hypothetical protein
MESAAGDERIEGEDVAERGGVALLRGQPEHALRDPSGAGPEPADGTVGRQQIVGGPELGREGLRRKQNAGPLVERVVGHLVRVRPHSGEERFVAGNTAADQEDRGAGLVLRQDLEDPGGFRGVGPVVDGESDHPLLGGDEVGDPGRQLRGSAGDETWRRAGHETETGRDQEQPHARDAELPHSPGP